jgi:hypothetical protein
VFNTGEPYQGFLNEMRFLSEAPQPQLLSLVALLADGVLVKLRGIALLSCCWIVRVHGTVSLFILITKHF